MDDHRIRPLCEHEHLKRCEHGARLGAVRATANAQVVIGLGDLQFGEEHRRHPVVVVLTGMDLYFVVMLSELETERRGLHELRACTDHCQNFHAATASLAMRFEESRSPC